LDTSIDATYKFCVPTCPTHFTGSPCAITALEEEIVSYNFNAPRETFPNLGTGGNALDVTVTAVNASGYPYKNRGLYFNQVDVPEIKIDGMTLHHTFSVRAWIYALYVPTDATVISKYRGDGETFFNLGIRKADLSTYKPYVTIASDTDPGAPTTINDQVGALNWEYWYYVGWGVEMISGKNSKIQIYYNDQKFNDKTI
jgi:hypothetical protein